MCAPLSVCACMGYCTVRVCTYAGDSVLPGERAREDGKEPRRQKERARARERGSERATAETEIERNRLDEASRRGTERTN